MHAKDSLLLLNTSTNTSTSTKRQANANNDEYMRRPKKDFYPRLKGLG
jgi:hypothetical protein